MLIDDVILSMIDSSQTGPKYIGPNGKEAKNETKVGRISFFPNQHFSVMDMDKFDRIDRLSGKNGLFPPVLPISPAFSFPVKGLVVVPITFLEYLVFG